MPRTASLHSPAIQLSPDELRRDFLARHQLAQQSLTDTLRSLGAVQYDLWLPETNALPTVLHSGEEIKGIVYGRYKQTAAKPDGKDTIGRGALVVTDQRIFLLDKKPMFTKCGEITFKEIRSVSYTKAFIAGNVTLHMEIGSLSVRTFNHKCARGFVSGVEDAIFKLVNG